MIIANADIYFDESLQRLPPPVDISVSVMTDKSDRPSWHNTVLALTKWIDKGTREHLQVYLRTDSQDAWVFQSPLRYSLIPGDGAGSGAVGSEAELLDIEMGVARCDNRLAYILTRDPHYQTPVPYRVLNTPFAIHAIEYDKRPRTSGLYDTRGAIVGDGQNILYSDAVYSVF